MDILLLIIDILDFTYTMNKFEYQTKRWLNFFSVSPQDVIIPKSYKNPAVCQPSRRSDLPEEAIYQKKRSTSTI